MRDGDAVVLVPGLFGFHEFGTGTPRIAYFDRVIDRLQVATGIPADRFFVHEPAPTGPLWIRVFALFELVANVLASTPGKKRVERVHLIGHSTGGVDVRLLANTKYHWPDEPDAAKRDHLLRRVASVIPISAPLRGTPIARRLRGALEFVIPDIFLLSILAKQQQRLKLSESMLMLYTSILHGVSGGGPREGVLRLLGGLDHEAAIEVGHFLGRIVEDHPLIDELTPLAMERLNERIAEGDVHPLHCFVTVSPAPSAWNGLIAGVTLRQLQWAIYAFAYGVTCPDDADAARLDVPRGPAIGVGQDDWELVRELLAPDASDGIVPAGAQTLDGNAAGIVAGDHLDVIGHFESEAFNGTTVFKSGSDFDDARFDAVWNAVANVISR